MKQGGISAGHPRRRAALTILAVAMLCGWIFPPSAHAQEYTTNFRIEDCSFSSVGTNPFFILEPGFQARLEGDTEDGRVVLVITVTTETREIDGVVTRMVEEREWEDGELIEVSRNYFAICTRTNSVFYFGEDVDIYDAGVIVSHEGAWRAGVGGAKPGIVMPGTILLGSRYYQEIASGVALDRAETVVMDATVVTPAGMFTGCIGIRETTPLDPGAQETKFYAPGIGLIDDGELSLAQVPINPPGADLNKDGFVDYQDLLMFQNNWHRGNPAAKGAVR